VFSCGAYLNKGRKKEKGKRKKEKGKRKKEKGKRKKDLDSRVTLFSFS